MMKQKFKYSPGGIIVPDYIVTHPRRPTAFSFFSGCGGMDLGLIQAEFEILGANEIDAAASITYMVNLGSYPINIHYVEGEADKNKLNDACERYIFGKKGSRKSFDALENHHQEKESSFQIHDNTFGSKLSGSGWIRHNPVAAPVRNFWFGNVRKLSGKKILDALGLRQGDIDCVCGGPPCQGFSSAGRQNIADPRNNLVYEYARLIVELQPKTFIMEEVPAIVDFFDPDGVPVLDKFAMILSDGGYGKWENVKKAMLMQSGCAAGMKSMRGNQKVGAGRRNKKRIPNDAKSGMEDAQISLFQP